MVSDIGICARSADFLTASGARGLQSRADLRLAAACAGRRGSRFRRERCTSLSWLHSVMLRSCALVHAPLTCLTSGPGHKKTHPSPDQDAILNREGNYQKGATLNFPACIQQHHLHTSAPKNGVGVSTESKSLLPALCMHHAKSFSRLLDATCVCITPGMHRPEQASLACGSHVLGLLCQQLQSLAYAGSHLGCQSDTAPCTLQFLMHAPAKNRDIKVTSLQHPAVRPSILCLSSLRFPEHPFTDKPKEALLASTLCITVDAQGR